MAPTTPVEPRNPEDLESIRCLVHASIALETACDYGGALADQAAGRRVFLAHWPELAHPLAQWDSAVERSRAAPAALWAWLAVACETHDLTEPEFSVGSVVDQIALLTLRRARNWQLATPHQLEIEALEDRHAAAGLVALYLKGQRIASLATKSNNAGNIRPGAAIDRVQHLFDSAQRSSQAQAISDARDRLLELQGPLLSALMSPDTTDGARTCRLSNSA